MNSIKRISALLLAALMAIALVPVSAFARAVEPVRDAETIVGWNFDSESPVATTANANNAGAAVAREDSGNAFSYYAGHGSAKGISSSGWNDASAASPKYYYVTVNAAGYTDVTVDAWLYASGTGPKNIQLYYSVDGTNFTAVEGASVSLAKSTWTELSGALPAECDGAGALILRLAVTDTVSANGDTIGTGGNLRMDDLVVSGTPAGETPPEPTDEPVVTEAPVVDPVTVAEALEASEGAEVLTEGVVTFIDNKNVYIEDTTGAICAFFTAAPSVALGDLIRVKGSRTTYKGLPELQYIDPTNAQMFTVVSSGNTLPVKTMTLADIAANYTSHLCERVLVKNAVLGAIVTNGNTTLTQDETTVNIYKIPAVDFNEGDAVDVIACISTYNALQLRVAQAADITEAEVLEPVEGPITIAEALALQDKVLEAVNKHIAD